jgi:hypothetical protein
MNISIPAQKPGFFQRRRQSAAQPVIEHNISAAEMMEDIRILKTLDKIKADLQLAHQNFDEATDETLIDVYIYEMKALNMKFKYYHGICKERGLVR